MKLGSTTQVPRPTRNSGIVPTAKQTMNVNALPMTVIQVQVKRVPSVLRCDLAACAQGSMLLPKNGHAGSVLT